MKSFVTLGESLVIVAATLLLISLPALAGGERTLWFAAQIFYFIGMAFMVGRYFSRYV